jgi:hypothetical protein
VHFLGTILNLSTVFMVGDRLARRAPLTTPQLLALNRGLSSAALWSPFFASMAVVIALVPSVQYAQIAVVGFPMAMLSGLLTTLELRRRFDLAEVDGFSLSPRSLLMPSGMAALVMLLHFWCFSIWLFSTSIRSILSTRLTCSRKLMAISESQVSGT